MSAGCMVDAGSTAQPGRRPRVSAADDAQHHSAPAAVRLAGDGQSAAGANHLADVLRPPAEGQTLSRSLRPKSQTLVCDQKFGLRPN